MAAMRGTCAALALGGAGEDVAVAAASLGPRLVAVPGMQRLHSSAEADVASAGMPDCKPPMSCPGIHTSMRLCLFGCGQAPVLLQ